MEAGERFSMTLRYEYLKGPLKMTIIGCMEIKAVQSISTLLDKDRKKKLTSDLSKNKVIFPTKLKEKTKTKTFSKEPESLNQFF